MIIIFKVIAMSDGQLFIKTKVLLHSADKANVFPVRAMTLYSEFRVVTGIIQGFFDFG